ncbi:MAG: AbrB/MazE/SpoVT family DNA-binding domain-containing protein [Leucobacter sp.]
MITTIDKAGRVVIPKAIRDAMQLRPGARLDVVYSDGRIEIEYAPVEARVRIAEDGFPIIEADLTEEQRAEWGALDIRVVREADYREREARWM